MHPDNNAKIRIMLKRQLLFATVTRLLAQNMTTREQIRTKAVEILRGLPHGLRYSQLLAAFAIRVRAAKHEPDMFYVNRCMKLIEDELFP